MFKRKKKHVVISEGGEEYVPYNVSDDRPVPETEGQLAIDVYQTPDEIIVESTIAGVSVDDLDIDVTSESVSIRGKRTREKSISDGDYFYQECFWGKFSRSVILPEEVDPDRAHSSLRNGVLTITLPKVQRGRARKIQISE